MTKLERIDDLTFRAFGQQFGFVVMKRTTNEEWPPPAPGVLTVRSHPVVMLGPLGAHSVPVSPKVGWSIVVGVAILAVVAATVVIRKRITRRPSHTY